MGIPPERDVLRCVSMMYGVLSVMWLGVKMTLELCVDNWASPTKVSGRVSGCVCECVSE